MAKRKSLMLNTPGLYLTFSTLFKIKAANFLQNSVSGNHIFSQKSPSTFEIYAKKSQTSIFFNKQPQTHKFMTCSRYLF